MNIGHSGKHVRALCCRPRNIHQQRPTINLAERHAAFNVNRSDVIMRYVPTHARGHWLSSFVILNEGKDLLELQDSSLRSE
jgi:hypothetical protein